MRTATTWLLDASADHEQPRAGVHLSNAYCVALAGMSGPYRQLLRTSGINFPDGAPVVALMRLLQRGQQRPGRVRGPSLFRLALRDGVRRELKHFFLGSTPETLAALEDSVRRTIPSIRIVGSYSPPFADLDENYVADLIDHVRDTAADIVWVSLSTPKQDFAADAIAERAGIMAVGIGAGFDFVAGVKPEAPSWVQRVGFEWAFRLGTEPSRLWRRYAVGNVVFMLIALRQLATAGLDRVRRKARR